LLAAFFNDTILRRWRRAKKAQVKHL